MRVFRSGVDSGETPQWYWTRGLHDALVLGMETRELPYDVTQRDPVRNCMIICLDAAGALFDTTVTAIRLYNYKVLRDESDVGGYGAGLTDCYRMQDRLRRGQGKWILDITALGEDDFLYSVRFDFAEVERK